jgi:peptide/nickel transport system substrate-binding protein
MAPVAPLFNLKQIDFVSKRIGNYVFSGEFNFLFQLAWVK